MKKILALTVCVILICTASVSLAADLTLPVKLQRQMQHDGNGLKGSIRIMPEEAAAHPEWMCDAGEMTWDLTIDKQVAFSVGYGASKPLRDAEAFAMYWHAEGMKSAFCGSITLNGKQYTVTPEKSYGYADKNWGRDFTSPWVWLSSNCLRSKKTGQMLQDSIQ